MPGDRDPDDMTRILTIALGTVVIFLSLIIGLLRDLLF